ncbi:uncharacterized protein BDZ99DRAFT_553773 [Mytilinidion resinicola]|uniref:Apple domain-containing protein n=1 Tax=Mytilinidion resinicola TaxID=574789 RepID=A0A6A6Z0Y0_9PEZI|nr:uncharacterized protein BDZ99DRAFT_553773 [Mytilinidion resinicola]KAF2813815.1 hypothetical protein BDZ99DRAFT_553773 [Mytilinidion resinicola]
MPPQVKTSTSTKALSSSVSSSSSSKTSSSTSPSSSSSKTSSVVVTPSSTSHSSSASSSSSTSSSAVVSSSSSTFHSSSATSSSSISSFAVVTSSSSTSHSSSSSSSSSTSSSTAVTSSSSTSHSSNAVSSSSTSSSAAVTSSSSTSHSSSVVSPTSASSTLSISLSSTSVSSSTTTSACAIQTNWVDYPNTDYWGTDDPSSPQVISTLAECKAACEALKICVAVSWLPSTNGGPSFCYLKDSVTNEVADTSAGQIGAKKVVTSCPVSAISSSSSSLVPTVTSTSSATPLPTTGCISTTGGNWMITPDTDYWGTDDTSSPQQVTTFDGCIATCNSLPNCVAVSYLPSTNGGASFCYLKDSVTNTVPETGVGQIGAKKVTSCPGQSSSFSSVVSTTISSSFTTSTMAITTTSPTRTISVAPHTSDDIRSACECLGLEPTTGSTTVTETSTVYTSAAAVTTPA